MEPYRLFLIGYFLYAQFKGKNKLHHGFERYLVAALVWVALSNIVRRGADGIEPSAIYFLEVWVGYLIGRNAITSIADFKRYIKNYLLLLLILVPFAIYESQTGHRILHVWASKLTGVYAEHYLGPEYFRYGVHRSSTIFSHPILYSVCASSLFVFVISKAYGSAQKTLFAIAVITALLTAMTSAGFLMVFLALILIAIERLSKTISVLKPMILYSGAFMLVVIELLSDRGAVKLIMSSLALNPQTAYMRYAQYEYSKDDIMANPLWGTGGEWTRPLGMPGSIDNYWIIMTLQFGLFNLIMMVLFWVGLARGLYAVRNVSLYFFYAYVSMTALGVSALTVHFFDRAQILAYMLLGTYSGLILIHRRSSKAMRNRLTSGFTGL
ncbi:MAG: hypothetical protein CMI67_22705 [Pelagibaca sp.]|nr:hypothetical protein [Pelagibaca sp.]